MRMFRLLVLLLGSARARAQAMHLLSSVPATGTGWTGGISVMIATELMLEEINRHPTLLPGQNLTVLWQDDRCDADFGSHLFLQNVFDERYDMLAPGVPVSMWDRNGDGVISTEETEQFAETWNRTHVRPRPVAYLAGSCSGVTGSIVNVAYHARLPVVAGVASFGGLSDRGKYRNFFRTHLPDSEVAYSFIKFAQLLGHRSMAVVSSLGDWALTVAQVTRFAEQAGMRLAGSDHRKDITGFRGVLLAADEAALGSDGAQGSLSMAVQELVRERQRFVMVLQYVSRVQLLLCEAWRKGYRTAVWMAMGWLRHGWWSEAKGACGAAEMGMAARWTVLGSMAYWRFDDDVRLSCSNGLTARELRAAWFRRQGADFGDLSKRPEGYTNRNEAATMMDAVCMLALALHEMVYVRGFGHEALAERGEAAYAAFQEVLAATDFEGQGGRVRFPPGSADPVASIQLEQVQWGELQVVAAYTAGSFGFPGAVNLTFHFDGETALMSGGEVMTLQHYASCPSGEKVDFATNRCGGCEENRTFERGDCLCSAGYRSEGGACVACPAGTFSKAAGSSSCAACDAGRSAAVAGSSGCDFCERGRYASERGAAICTACPPSQTTEQIARESVADCVCKLEAYRVLNSTACQDCPNNATASSSGAGVASCRCAEGTFMTKDFSRCQACPAGSDTDGEGHGSIASCLCPAGQYLSSSECRPCPEHMVCPAGSNAANERFLGRTPGERGRYERFPDLEPGYWSSAEEPWALFKCRSKERCPGGSPGHACQGRLVGLACEHCEEGFMWEGKRCVECSRLQGNLLMFPIIPIAFVFVGILAAYKFLRDPLPKWGSWQNSSAVLLFIALNHYQILGVLSQQNITLPEELRRVLELYDSANSVSLGFGLDCVGLSELVPAMMAKAIAPVVITLAAAMLFGGSRWLSRGLGTPCLDGNRLINVLGSFMFTFFGAISAMSLLLFKCADNPSGQQTLSVDMSVVCWASPVWRRGLGIGVACVLLYIMGMGGCFLYIICAAPRRFSEASFRTRWKFLFIKFHAGAYWWGVVFLAKNFLINLVPALPVAAVSKLYLSMTVIMAYLAGMVATMPYRVSVANVFDLLVGACLLYSAALLTWWVGQRSTAFDGVAMGTLLLTLLPLFYLPLGLGFLVLRGKKARPTSAQLLAAELEFKTFSSSFRCFSSLSEHSGMDLLLCISEGDRCCLRAADLVIRTDLLGRGNSHRLSEGSRKAEEDVASEVSSLHRLSSGSRKAEELASEAASPRMDRI